MTDLTIFHYHLLPGGVTSVISHSVEAVLNYSRTVKRIRIVCGRADNADRVVDDLRAKIDSGPESLSLEIVPEIDYLDGKPGEGDVDHLESLLLSRFGGGIWWIHNYHLGKNTAFTRALLRIAERAAPNTGGSRRKQRKQDPSRESLRGEPPQKILFQIHDFPECGRYANLHRVREEVNRPLYPAGPGIAYAAINERDAGILRKAGIPERDVYRLDNPVPTRRQSDADLPDPEESRRILFDTHGAGSTRLFPAGKLLLYPVRTIRRKNVLEAGLLATISPDPVNLIVTLPGTSSQEKAYSDLVARSFAEGLIPGFWGIGPELAERDGHGLTFPALAACVDIVISSSIQEGFGYMFIDALGWRKPIFARYMDILEGIIAVFPTESSRFYDSLRVPLTKTQADSLRNRYRERLDSLKELIPADAAGRLRKSIGHITAARTRFPKIPLIGHTSSRAELSRTTDFSFLPVDMQYQVLQNAQKQAYAADVRALNPDLFQDLRTVIASEQSSRDEEIRDRFGFPAFAAGVDRIVESLESHSDGTPEKSRSQAYRHYNPEKTEHAMITEFAVLDNLRLLYAY